MLKLTKTFLPFLVRRHDQDHASFSSSMITDLILRSIPCSFFMIFSAISLAFFQASPCSTTWFANPNFATTPAANGNEVKETSRALFAASMLDSETAPRRECHTYTFSENTWFTRCFGIHYSCNHKDSEKYSFEYFTSFIYRFERFYAVTWAHCCLTYGTFPRRERPKHFYDMAGPASEFGHSIVTTYRSFLMHAQPMYNIWVILHVIMICNHDIQFKLYYMVLKKFLYYICVMYSYVYMFYIFCFVYILRLVDFLYNFFLMSEFSVIKILSCLWLVLLTLFMCFLYTKECYNIRITEWEKAVWSN